MSEQEKKTDAAKRIIASSIIQKSQLDPCMKVFCLCLLSNGCPPDILGKSLSDLGQAAKNIKMKMQKADQEKKEQQEAIRQLLGNDFNIDFGP